MKAEEDFKIGDRWVEDTVGATVGAATGAGVTAVLGLAVPVIASIVPWGVIVGSIAGVVFKELTRKP